MDEVLKAHYLATDYRVRLAQGGHASLRIGAPLPATLIALLRHATEPWSFVSACNPHSQAQPRAANRHAQRALLAALQARADSDVRIRAGVGVGANVWRETSLFVLGLEFAAIDAIIQPYRQNAIVRGHGVGIAQLHWLPIDDAAHADHGHAARGQRQ